MPYLSVDLDALKDADAVASLLDLRVGVVIGGLVRLWAHCWQHQTDRVSALGLEAQMQVASPRLVEALAEGGFIEPLADGEIRVRGAQQYLRIRDAQRAAGAATAARRWGSRADSSTDSSTDSSADSSTDRSTDRSSIGPSVVVHRSTESPSHREEESKAMSAPGADAPAPASDAGAPAERPPPALVGALVPIPPGSQPGATPPLAAEEAVTTKAPRKQADADAEEAVELWNRLAHPDFARVSRLTPGRRKAIRAAVDLLPLADWPKAIAAVNAWPWANGQDGGGTWRASFDWLVASDKHRTPNLLRAFEGQLNAKRRGDVRHGPVRAEDSREADLPSGPVDLSQYVPGATP